MRREKYTMNNVDYIRVDKKRARKIFELGIGDVLVTTVNCSLINNLSGITVIHKKTPENFDMFVGYYNHYNCCPEAGYYAKFFVEETVLNAYIKQLRKGVSK